MPFLNLDNNWSNLAPLYNQAFTNRPTVPVKVNQYVAFDDGFIRGGTINAYLATTQDVVRIGKFLTGLSNISRATDFKDTTLQTATKGILFLTKQLGLQQANPRLEWKNPNSLPPLLGGATRQFTGAGTILSIGGSAFGLHFDRAGLLGDIKDDQKYGGGIDSLKEGVVWNNNFGNGRASNLQINRKSQNRLVRYLAKVTGKNDRFYSERFSRQFPVNLDNKEAVDRLLNDYKSDSTVLDNYIGGSESVYGVGYTFIKTSADSRTIINSRDFGSIDLDATRSVRSFPQTISYSSGKANPTPTTSQIGGKTFVTRQATLKKIKSTNPLPGISSLFIIGNRTTEVEDTTLTLPALREDLVIKFNGFVPLSNNQIQSYENIGGFDNPNSKKDLKGQLSLNQNIYNQKLANINIEQRIGVSSKTTIDAINSISIVDSTTYYKTLNAGTTNPSSDGTKTDAKGNRLAYSANINKEDLDGYFGRDLARLAIEFINNDNPVSTDVLAFRAYIDDLNDGMTAKWNPFRYMGRGEEFYVYDGFTRDISLAFTIYAHGPKEMKPLYQKLNYLMSTFTPDYRFNKMRGNIAYLTVGDYISKQPGIFTDIKISGLLDHHWEINLDYGLNKTNKKNLTNEERKRLELSNTEQNVVPKMIKVGLSFKPIHSRLPRKVTKDRPFLSNFILPDPSTSSASGNGKLNKYLSDIEKQ